jgi:hypothetical protein
VRRLVHAVTDDLSQRSREVGTERMQPWAPSRTVAREGSLGRRADIGFESDDHGSVVPFHLYAAAVLALENWATVVTFHQYRNPVTVLDQVRKQHVLLDVRDFEDTRAARGSKRDYHAGRGIRMVPVP